MITTTIQHFFAKLILTLITFSFSTLSLAATERDLIHAIIGGEIELVRTVLNEGISANSMSADTTTALQWAAQGNHNTIAQLLLENGADANIANRYGVTAATLAAENGNAEIMQLLLAAGVCLLYTSDAADE